MSYDELSSGRVLANLSRDWVRVRVSPLSLVARLVVVAMAAEISAFNCASRIGADVLAAVFPSRKDMWSRPSTAIRVASWRISSFWAGDRDARCTDGAEAGNAAGPVEEASLWGDMTLEVSESSFEAKMSRYASRVEARNDSTWRSFGDGRSRR